MNELERVCEQYKLRPFDVFLNAMYVLEEDIRDVVDPYDVYKLYLETGIIPTWVRQYCLIVLYKSVEHNSD